MLGVTDARAASETGLPDEVVLAVTLAAEVEEAAALQVLVPLALSLDDLLIELEPLSEAALEPEADDDILQLGVMDSEGDKDALTELHHTSTHTHSHSTHGARVPIHPHEQPRKTTHAKW